MTEIKLSVSGMTCGSCVKHVTKALESLDGVSNINVDLNSGVVRLDRVSDRTDDLINALNEDGYPSTLFVSGTQAPQKKSGGCCCG